MKKLVVLSLAVILGTGATVFANVVPPWRGDEGSTWQQWDFSSDSTNPDPDDGSNPYGDPALTVYAVEQRIPDPGAWPLSGEIDVYIPNRNLLLERKEIWLQLTWQAGGNDTNPSMPDEPWVAVTPFQEMHMFRTDTTPNTWTHSLFEITIWPNPPGEWITIKGDIIVDQVIIDTICIPEPATMFTLAIGGLMVLTRKRHLGRVL
ncbi:MAG: PEP-CTERM sorting domain-containing protein [Planctomycetota bacterium]|nr:MAG: PEP-CTERM sorting domain-containing protein [Planctomycetota bacterium]